ncbi:MAG TPA: hypothetical protein VLT36_12085, partial [Candidatus Dormibacteraeota bacterium]|nr:hypothetical protein [Candidatus Dormibacteraeota bacterium]
GYHSLVLLDDGTFHPQLYNLAQKSGRFTALLQTANRHDYTVEFKDALTAPSWTPLSTNSGNGALRPVLDPSASGPQRFYRVRQW